MIPLPVPQFPCRCSQSHKWETEGLLPFEVHDTFWDSCGGVEGGQEFLSELDGLYAEHLEGSKGIVNLGCVGYSHCKKLLLVDEPDNSAGPRAGGALR